MSDMIEISEIDINQNSSSNFGGGLELLMNDKKHDSKNSRGFNVDLQDLDNLESELNFLSETNSNDVFNNTVRFDDEQSVENLDIPIPIGKNTLEQEPIASQSTWDGFNKFDNNAPINPDKVLQPDPKMTAEQILRDKFKYLRKLEDLERKGVELSKKYNMESPLQEMKGEYETIIEEKKKQNSIKFQGNMFMAAINGIEFLNGKFDPFDIKLDGWGEQFNENMNDYDDVFGELYEKYSSKASMAPELKLLFQLGGSAMMVHMTNTMFKSSMPGVDDILRQNPDLMKSFQSAAVNSMSDTNPGFSGFMNNMMNTEMPSPPPQQTQRRPTFQHNDGINLNENSRPEMRGPSDISDLLSGLKTKNINIQEHEQVQPDDTNLNPIDNSTISISDLKDLQSNANMPQKSKRRKKSASNTVSLDF